MRNAKESRVYFVATGNQNNKPKIRGSFRNNAFHWDPNPPPTHLQVDHLWPKTEQKKIVLTVWKKKGPLGATTAKMLSKTDHFFGGQGVGHFE